MRRIEREQEKSRRNEEVRTKPMGQILSTFEKRQKSKILVGLEDEIVEMSDKKRAVTELEDKRRNFEVKYLENFLSEKVAGKLM